MIERMVEGFRRQDPPSTTQLAVPITVPNLIFRTNMASSDPHQQAIGCLTLIAFYYLLRVGEYTQPKFVYRNGKKCRTSRTVQFTVKNVGFFKQGKVVKRSAPLDTLLQCDAATLKITNQKNGRMGDTIHHEAVNIDECPIKALAYRVHHILSHNGSDASLLCAVCNKHAEWPHIQSSDIVKGIRAAALTLKLKQQAIDPDLIGAHSLQAGGATALKLHGASDIEIKKFGRWSSLTFTQYIHTQIAHLSSGVSKRMSQELPFVNIAAFD